MQYRLAAASILAAWETGASRRPLDRAIAILWAAAGEADIDPADLPLAERDRRLLEIRAATFGPTLRSQATCPHCGAELEMELDARSLGAALPLIDDSNRSFRSVTSRDLAAVIGVPPDRLAATLRTRLAGRALDGAEAASLDRQIEEDIAAAELSANIACSECGAAWRETLDVVEHVWTDVESTALKLLGDVAALAAAFGWSEREILSLSPARRMTYLSWARQA